MLSLVDLKDFAEICRAIEEYAASGKHLTGPIGPGRPIDARARGGDDWMAADGAMPSRRLHRNAGGRE